MRILVTGANRGIGAAIVATYRDDGIDVIGTSRNPTDGDDLRPLDVTKPASIQALVDGFGTGPLDLLVCNAGIKPEDGNGLDLGYPAQDWADTFAVNVTGVFLTIQALLPNLRAAQGKIAILSSVMGSQARAPGGSLIYRASKAAALNLGRNLARDLASDGVAVGIYHPGWVRTEMGGDDADIDAESSARGLTARFAALGPNTSGCFEDYRGIAIAL